MVRCVKQMPNEIRTNKPGAAAYENLHVLDKMNGGNFGKMTNGCSLTLASVSVKLSLRLFKYLFDIGADRDEHRDYVHPE